jgi:hypothetical protein
MAKEIDTRSYFCVCADRDYDYYCWRRNIRRNIPPKDCVTACIAGNIVSPQTGRNICTNHAINQFTEYVHTALSPFYTTDIVGRVRVAPRVKVMRPVPRML